MSKDNFDILLNLIAGPDDDDELEELEPSAHSTFATSSVQAQSNFIDHRTHSLVTNAPSPHFHAVKHTPKFALAASRVTHTITSFVPSHCSPAPPNLTGIQLATGHDVPPLFLPQSHAIAHDLLRPKVSLKERRIDITHGANGIMAKQPTTRTSHSPSHQTPTYPFTPRSLSSSSHTLDIPYRAHWQPYKDPKPEDVNPFQVAMNKDLLNRPPPPKESSSYTSRLSSDNLKQASFTHLRDAVHMSIDNKRRATATLSESLCFARQESHTLQTQFNQLGVLADELQRSNALPSPNKHLRRRARFASGHPISTSTSTSLPSISTESPSPFESWATDFMYPKQDPTVPRSLAAGHDPSSAGNECHPAPRPSRQPFHRRGLSTSTTPSALQRRQEGRTSPPMDEIEFLSGSQARRALRSLLAALDVPPILPESFILEPHPNEPSPPPSPVHHVPSTDPSSIDDVIRALDFVRYVDNVLGSEDNPLTDGRNAVFSEENVKTMADRLMRWEQLTHGA
ncbi:hypothetical protein FRB95_012518 [Tulasnella sp. JGI-2019a]|nr:hypothetical protein FRB95_012518 [Tulasnella sp. JGI-2019a]